jgi:hypothetical protein
MQSIIVKVGINLIMYKHYFKGHVTKMTVPWLMQLVTILSQQRLSFACKSVHVSFGGASGTGTGFFSEYFCFPQSVSFHQCSTFIQLIITDTI